MSYVHRNHIYNVNRSITQNSLSYTHTLARASLHGSDSDVVVSVLNLLRTTVCRFPQQVKCFPERGVSHLTLTVTNMRMTRMPRFQTYATDLFCET